MQGNFNSPPLSGTSVIYGLHSINMVRIKLSYDEKIPLYSHDMALFILISNERQPGSSGELV